MSRYKTIEYNTRVYNFVELIGELFDTKDLDKLHELTTNVYSEQFKVGMDSTTIFHNNFYDKLRSGWPELKALYESFICGIVSRHINEDFLYQEFPTFRVHLLNNVAVGAFHNDGEFGHPAGEINFIIPLTNSDGTASIWIESEPKKEDFEAIPMQIGSLITFNGNELTHGNKMNTTDRTRVSMDFRVLPLSKYDENNTAESITRKTKFKEGGYYKRFTK